LRRKGYATQSLQGTPDRLPGLRVRIKGNGINGLLRVSGAYADLLRGALETGVRQGERRARSPGARLFADVLSFA